MAILLNAVNLLLCLRWFHRSGTGAGRILAIVGAFLVNGMKSWLTVTAPEFWLYFLGALFIAVTLYLPQGVVGLVRKLSQRRGDAS